MATILSVDGCPDNRHFISTLLGSFGHHVVEAGDGIEALETIKIQHPDLVITDVLMRAMDGYEFVEHLHSDSTAASTPVIFYVAACYETEARTAAAECGIQQILTKPTEPQVILAAVNAALGNHTLEVSAARMGKFDRHRLTPPRDPIDVNATVFLVDDDPTVRRLLSAVISRGRLKVETFASAEEFLEDYKDRPGCLVLDLEMPSMNGMVMLEALRGRRMGIPAIILTSNDQVSVARHAMRLGVLDFLDKSVDRRTLLSRVYCALQEDAIHRYKYAKAEIVRQRMAALTARERDLVKLLIDGRASKQIASELQISIRTVANHRSHLMAKTGATNVADLVRMSMIARDA